MAMLMRPFLPTVPDSQTGYADLVPTGLGQSNAGSTFLSDDLSPPLGKGLGEESSEELYQLLQSAEYGYPPLPGASSLTAAPPTGFPSLLDDLFSPSSDFLWESAHSYGSPVSDSSSAFSSGPSSPFSSPALSPEEEQISGIVSSLKQTADSVEFQYSPNQCLPYPSSADTLPTPLSPASSSVALSSPAPSYSYSSPSISPLDSPLSSNTTSRKRQQLEERDPTFPQPAKQRTKMARKERKKEQNKTAAIRYRQKKKQEAELLLLQQQKLEKKNRQLHRHVDGLLAEISYLKKLWQEVSAARKHK